MNLQDGHFDKFLCIFDRLDAHTKPKTYVACLVVVRFGARAAFGTASIASILVLLIAFYYQTRPAV